jgi:glyoxylase-like metal-dependent hydrolase (beta-lactamase superfamily II)
MSDEFRRWKVGDAWITRIVEIGPMFMPPQGLFPASTREQVKARAWLQPCFADADGQINLSFQCFLIEAGGRRILVDTCIGDNKRLAQEAFSGRVTQFLGTLGRAGAGPDQIDTVLCTHLHFDHVGWNTRLVDGAWVPTFPKARYLFARDEVAFALEGALEAGDESVAESIRPILDAGLADLVATDHRICAEVRFEPTPGHTPGHVSVVVESGGAQAIISGDAFHHPLQLAHPGMASSFCEDAALGEATRRRLFASIAGQPVLLIGSHFCEPSAGLVTADGDGWRLEPVWAESLAGPTPLERAPPFAAADSRAEQGGR